MRIVGYVIVALVLLVGGGWYSWQPTVRAERESLGDDSVFLQPVPTDSVRLLPTFGGDGCVPLRVLARLHVQGRLFSPSDQAVHRALRREAGSMGANAVAFTSPSMDDLPVLGLVDRLWQDEDDAGSLRHNERQVGRAVALRCNGLAR